MYMNDTTINTDKNYFITGAAGFIGFYLAKNLLDHGCQVIGIDNMNDYYDVQLKQARLEQLKSFDMFTFIEADISDKELLMKVFETHKPNVVVNLAAQAGVRYSLENPDVYVQSN